MPIALHQRSVRIGGDEGRHRRPVLMVLLGRRRRARRAQGRGAAQARDRNADDHRARPAGELHAGAAPAARAARASAARRDPGREVGDRPGERRAAEHRPQPVDAFEGQARPPAGALRRSPPPRADDAGDLHVRARLCRRPGGRHLPRARQPGLEHDRQAGVGVPDGPDRPPDRGHRGGPRLGGALVPGRVRADSERRTDAARGGPRRPREPNRLRGAARPAQGDAAAPAPACGSSAPTR